MSKRRHGKSALVIACWTALALAFSSFGQATSSSSTWAITIVLAPRLQAGGPATLAVLGVDGRLAAGVKVELSDGQTLTTDSTGRAFFTVPEGASYLLAKGSGASAAALIDSAASAAESTISLPQLISAHDTFSICGGGLRGDSDANHVTIGNQLSLVLAASPSCIVILPGPYVQPGPQTVAVETSAGRWTASTTVVSLEFAAPDPPLRPGKKGRITVRVRGSALKLNLAVDNRSPGVLAFSRGDTQELWTSGGEPNVAPLAVETIRSGDFSFHARLLPAPQPALAARYLEAAATLAPRNLQDDVEGLAGKLSHNGRSAASVRNALDAMIAKTIASDFQTLLQAARSSL